MAVTCSNTCLSSSSSSSTCYDFTIKRGDSLPSFVVSLTDEELDIVENIAEPRTVNTYLWCSSRLGTSIDVDSDEITLLDDVNFTKVSVGDTIVFLGNCTKEEVTATAIDAVNKTVTINRPNQKYAHVVQEELHIFKVWKKPDNGSVNVEESQLTYNWDAIDTNTPGEFLLELEIVGSDNSKLSFPRIASGYSVLIQKDSYGG